MTGQQMTFRSGSLECRGWLARPDGVAPPWPAVVLAHGLSATHAFHYWDAAERFARAGFAAFDFDPRHVGASEGEPRQALHPRRQVEDILAAVAFLRASEQVDPARIAVWGSSLGGGLVPSRPIRLADRRSPDELRPIPAGFTEAVEVARSEGDRPMLAVLADEAAGFDWSLAGARIVGRAQFELSAWPDARETWDSIRRKRPDDPEANLMLGTVLQRMGELAESSAALQRVLGRSELSPRDRAEALALVARNAKTRWIDEWSGAADVNERRACALRSGFLAEARTAYDDGFSAASEPLVLRHQLPGARDDHAPAGRGVADVWAEGFEDPDRETASLAQQRAVLESAVGRALDAQEFRHQRFGEARTEWLELTRADFAFLTSARPGPVAARYRRAQARLGDQARFAGESAAAQIRMFLRLGVLVENARAALEALGVAEQAPAIPDTPRPRILVFAGHRIDAPGRETRRFPPDRAERAAVLIREAVQAEQKLAGSAPIEGLAGGASGGDTIFHEVCAELGISTSLMLALPRDAFAAASVADAGPDWVERFRRLHERLAVSVLAENAQLPDWLATRSDYSIWHATTAGSCTPRCPAATPTSR